MHQVDPIFPYKLNVFALKAFHSKLNVNGYFNFRKFVIRFFSIEPFNQKKSVLLYGKQFPEVLKRLLRILSLPFQEAMTIHHQYTSRAWLPFIRDIQSRPVQYGAFALSLPYITAIDSALRMSNSPFLCHSYHSPE